MKVRWKDAVAQSRGQRLAQMALAWVLRHRQVTSARIGSSQIPQIEDSVGTLKNLTFTSKELQMVETVLEG